MKVQVQEIFPFSSEELSSIVILSIPDGIEPKIGSYLRNSRDKGLWRITGIITRAVNRKLENIMEERNKLGLWDCQVKKMNDNDIEIQKGAFYTMSEEFPFDVSFSIYPHDLT